ncbi:MAG TPA: phosphatidylserine/phosphatidylglycerophosphate/cardiolipin synthase family protein [Bdellovibrionota bacterium]|jgi:putative cardiolipin synthase
MLNFLFVLAAVLFVSCAPKQESPVVSSTDYEAKETHLDPDLKETDLKEERPSSPLLVSLESERSNLDRLTGTRETFNKVQLLHMGKNSLPVRLSLIKSAQRYVFISVPYWFDDSSGTAIYNALDASKKQNSTIEMRVLEDWVSPGSTGDLFGVKMFGKLERLTGGKALLWNTPKWNRVFSQKLLSNRLHDKLLVVDGTSLLMGGMNTGDFYLKGSVSRGGWHDTDILVEGPAAAVAAGLFLKVWEAARYLSLPSNPFPTEAKEAYKALENYFYRGVEQFKFIQKHEGSGYIGFSEETQYVHIPYREQLSKFGLDPEGESMRVEGGVPVRLIYDNPLFNQPDASGKRPFCRFQCVLDFLFRHTTDSVRMFSPYLTLSKRQEKLLVDTAKRGIKVEIITNSLNSNDMGGNAYFAGVSHYLPLLEAGVRIYEWQGNVPLVNVEKKEKCAIPEEEWPGSTLHSKTVVLDGQVGIVGSNNMNVRSEDLNSEVMAIVSDRAFAGQLNEVFESALDLGADPIVPCGTTLQTRPRKVLEVGIEAARELVRKNRAKIDFAKKYQDMM